MFPYVTITYPKMTFLKDLKKLLQKWSRSSFKFLFNLYAAFFRPQLGYSCKFQPTCSQYSKEAYQNHSVIKATGLTALRILRCHPFGRGGFDPVPSNKEVVHGR